MGAEEMLIEAIGVDEVATERAFIDGQRSDDSSFTLGTARLNSLQGREKRLVVVALAFSVVAHMVVVALALRVVVALALALHLVVVARALPVVVALALLVVVAFALHLVAAALGT